MAYQTGTANSGTDLLDKFRLFAVAQGWTVNRWTTAGNGRELCIEKGSSFFNFRSFEGETMLINNSNGSNKYGIVVNGSDGYNSGAAWDRQPGYPQMTTTGANNQCHAFVPFVTNTGPFPAYHFLSPNPDTIYCEIEVITGAYERFGIGKLDLFNPSTPGEGRFFYATAGTHVTNSTSSTSWLGSHYDSNNYTVEMVPFRAAGMSSSATVTNRASSFLRIAHDSFDNWSASGFDQHTYRPPSTCQGGGIQDRIVQDLSPNPLNGIAVMTPNIVAINRNREFLSPVGVMPGLRYMDMTNYLPGEEFTLGSDTWKVFPWYAKGGISYERGIVLLKVD